MFSVGIHIVYQIQKRELRECPETSVAICFPAFSTPCQHYHWLVEDLFSSVFYLQRRSHVIVHYDKSSFVPFTHLR